MHCTMQKKTQRNPENAVVKCNMGRLCGKFQNQNSAYVLINAGGLKLCNVV